MWVATAPAALWSQAPGPDAVDAPGGTAPAPAPTPVVTAAGAVEVVARERGRPYAESLVHVVGVGGTHQPTVWRVLARDPYRPGAIRDFAVDRGRVVGDQFVPPAYHERVPAAVIPSTDFRFDSDAVFRIADRAAREAGVGFDALDYEIRVLGASDTAVPLWLVRLNDREGRTVGELAVRSRDGAVVRQEWFPEGKGFGGERYAAVPTAAASDPATSDEAAVPEALASGMAAARHGLERGGQAVRTGLQRAGGSVRRFFQDLLGEPEPTAPESAPHAGGPPPPRVESEQPVVIPVAAPVNATRYH